MTIKEKMKAHDWFYEFSDDGRVFDRGASERQEILRELGKLPADQAQALWEKYRPANLPAGSGPEYRPRSAA